MFMAIIWCAGSVFFALHFLSSFIDCLQSSDEYYEDNTKNINIHISMPRIALAIMFLLFTIVSVGNVIFYIDRF